MTTTDPQPRTNLRQDPTGQPVEERPPGLVHHMITLMLLNLGLTALLTTLVVVFQEQLLDYPLSHLDLPAGTDLASAREVLRRSVWGLVLPLLLVALAYVFMIRRLRSGRHAAHRAVIVVSVFGLLGFAIALVQPLPWWAQAIHWAKAVTMVALIVLATRPRVRDWFTDAYHAEQFDRFGE
ncbi:hypothetical protein ACVCAH_15405 [Micromonospora sp. LZ34]